MSVNKQKHKWEWTDSAWSPRFICCVKSLLIRNPVRLMEIFRVSKETWFKVSESRLLRAAEDTKTDWPPGNNSNHNKKTNRNSFCFIRQIIKCETEIWGSPVTFRWKKISIFPQNMFLAPYFVWTGWECVCPSTFWVQVTTLSWLCLSYI